MRAVRLQLDVRGEEETWIIFCDDFQLLADKKKKKNSMSDQTGLNSNHSLSGISGDRKYDSMTDLSCIWNIWSYLG